MKRKQESMIIDARTLHFLSHKNPKKKKEAVTSNDFPHEHDIKSAPRNCGYRLQFSHIFPLMNENRMN